jgi:hypothetical protein
MGGGPGLGAALAEAGRFSDSDPGDVFLHSLSDPLHPRLAFSILPGPFIHCFPLSSSLYPFFFLRALRPSVCLSLVSPVPPSVSLSLPLRLDLILNSDFLGASMSR